MINRREFMKLLGLAGLSGVIPKPLAKAIESLATDATATLAELASAFDGATIQFCAADGTTLAEAILPSPAFLILDGGRSMTNTKWPFASADRSGIATEVRFVNREGGEIMTLEIGRGSGQFTLDNDYVCLGQEIHTSIDVTTSNA